MAGCVLHANLENLDDMEAFLRQTHLDPYQVFRVGEEIVIGAKIPRRFENNGFKVEVSETDELSDQIADAIAFLSSHQMDLKKLSVVENMSAFLDFGIWQRDSPAQFDSFPPDLLFLAGSLGIGIMLSRYAMRSSEEQP